MDVPAGYKRWRFHWFECPSCGHRASRAFAEVSMAREPMRIVWRFWCERCGAFAALKQPMMPGVAAALILLFVGPIAFVALYRGLLAGLSFPWLVLVFAAFWILYPLVFLAITRYTYRYLPAT
jgi:hypothetical protein